MFLNLFVFFFGLAIGSFLNCVIYRLALPNFSLKNLGGLKSRSFCPHCKQVLSWQDLIPVFSFLILKGRCRYCQEKISWQYPLVELSTAFLFLLAYNFLPVPRTSPWYYFYYWTVISFLIIIFVYDLKHYLIPDKIIYPAILIVFAFRIWDLFLISNFEFRIFNPFISALAAATFFLFIVLISKGRWMGIGDIKLAFFMGLFLGFPNILIALFLSFLIGAIIGIGLILANKKTLKSEVPFGPFLVTGTFITLFFGEKIIQHYLNLFIY